MTVICNETATQKKSSWIPVRFQFFPELEIKNMVFVGKILWHFDMILHIWLIDIPVMIKILYEMIKILHEKM